MVGDSQNTHSNFDLSPLGTKMSQDEAFRRYQQYPFDTDERWKQYCENLTFTTTSNIDVTMERIRQKWYQRNVVRVIEAADCVSFVDESMQNHTIITLHVTNIPHCYCIGSYISTSDTQ